MPEGTGWLSGQAAVTVALAVHASTMWSGMDERGRGGRTGTRRADPMGVLTGGRMRLLTEVVTTILTEVLR